MTIEYRVNANLQPEQLAAVFERSGIRRPVREIERIRKMITHANLTVTAWDGEALVGVARALTDFCWCCYLSDLAVDKSYQRQGIGRTLIERVQAEAGDETSLLLLAAPEAAEYYPKIGFEPVLNGWLLPRR